ncbi:BLUF domain-containing protein [Hymenobacter sp. B1770]|uniref:BLUF domain-containing protein n=1 Tax=Hymenobacter sp. B1770 TaxID=1718788 RepID=UPI003CF4F1DC
MPEPTLTTAAQRQRAVAWVLALTANTLLAPGRYERQLLDRYKDGGLILDEVLALLVAAPYQLLYRSRATTLPTEADLQRLLDQSREWNAEASITGLLLYSNGRYVQVLEGPQTEVQALYARILRDPRHTQVATLSEGLGPARRFAAWRMALGNVAQPAVARLLDAVLAEEPFHGVPIDELLLHQLLEAFGVNSEATVSEVA